MVSIAHFSLFPRFNDWTDRIKQRKLLTLKYELGFCVSLPSQQKAITYLAAANNHATDMHSSDHVTDIYLLTTLQIFIQWPLHRYSFADHTADIRLLTTPHIFHLFDHEALGKERERSDEPY